MSTTIPDSIPAALHRLPRLAEVPFLTDGGLETTLVFHEGIDLPCFAAFDLLRRGHGRETLRRYFERYIALAHRHESGFILESPTWRANPDWAAKLGYSPAALAQANRDAIGLMHELREAFETLTSPMLISGGVGPRGDGYQPGAAMSADEAQRYHGPQLRTYRDAGADLGAAITMNRVEEALGVARAAAALDFPVVISFTLETDGKLPTGQTLREAIETIDAQTTRPPLYYMINCAHPTHFDGALTAGEAWLRRIGGLRANASTLSHAELDESTELDEGDPREFGRQHLGLLDKLPNMKVVGGCCGTDERHVDAIAGAWLSRHAQAQAQAPLAAA